MHRAAPTAWPTSLTPRGHAGRAEASGGSSRKLLILPWLLQPRQSQGSRPEALPLSPWLTWSGAEPTCPGDLPLLSVLFLSASLLILFFLLVGHELSL